MDLADELASGGKHESRGVSLPGTSVAAMLRLCRRGARAVGERSRKDGEKETAGLARAGL